MMILLHPKYFRLLAGPSEPLTKFAAEARIQPNTPIVIVEDLPEEDDEGNPIFAFSVSAGETHYWRGEPIKTPVLSKRTLDELGCK